MANGLYAIVREVPLTGLLIMVRHPYDTHHFVLPGVITTHARRGFC